MNINNNYSSIDLETNREETLRTVYENSGFKGFGKTRIKQLGKLNLRLGEVVENCNNWKNHCRVVVEEDKTRQVY